MDIQDTKEQRQAFEATQNPIVFERIVYIEKANLFTMKDDFRDDLFTMNKCNELNFGWSIWQAAKAQAVQEWISVEDNLPNRQVNVLVASKHDFLCIASLTNNHKNNKFYDGDGFAINSITHWMPLPKPPKAQEPTND